MQTPLLSFCRDIMQNTDQGGLACNYPFSDDFLKKITFLSNQEVPYGPKYISRDFKTYFTRFQHLDAIFWDFQQKILKSDSYCLCRYLLWDSPVNSVKTCKIWIFNSKFTFMAFYTPINVAKDRLDLSC